MRVQINADQLDELTKFMAAMPGRNERARNSAMKSVGFMLKDDAKKAVGANTLGWPDVSNLTLASRAFPASRGSDRISSERIAVAREASAYLIETTGFGSLQSIHQAMDKDFFARNVTKRIWGSLAGLLVYSLEATGELLFGFKSGTFGRKYAWTKKPEGTVGTINRGIENQGEKAYRDNVITDWAVELARRVTEGYSHAVTSLQQRYYAALGFKFRRGTILRFPARPLVGPSFLASKPAIPSLFREKFWASLRRNTIGSDQNIESVFGKVAA